MLKGLPTHPEASTGMHCLYLFACCLTIRNEVGVLFHQHLIDTTVLLAS